MTRADRIPSDARRGSSSDLEHAVRVQLGRQWLASREVGALVPGSVIELSGSLSDEVEVLAAGKPIARGELVAVRDAVGVRVTRKLAQQG